MQCSWVKRLFEGDFHDWKVIPLFLIGKNLGKNLKFYYNIDIIIINNYNLVGKVG